MAAADVSHRSCATFTFLLLLSNFFRRAFFAAAVYSNICPVFRVPIIRHYVASLVPFESPRSSCCSCSGPDLADGAERFFSVGAIFREPLAASLEAVVAFTV